MLRIIESDIDSDDGKLLISELNQILIQITGEDGTIHFHKEDTKVENAVFLIAYLDDIPYGCGALRKISNDTAEIKRIYARKNTIGIGRAIVRRLEERAQKFGYRYLLLETRVQNTHAIQFYESCGYVHCDSYGVYKGKDNAYCFSKSLMQ